MTPKVAAIILAAGLASRYREQDASVVSKVVADHEGKALVRHVAEAALQAEIASVIVVTGHARDAVEAALAGLDVHFLHNEDFAQGLSTSLRSGVATLRDDVDGALVLLADMPLIDAALLNRIVHHFSSNRKADAIVPVYEGQRGNPVLLARSMFGAVAALRGDEGARRLLGEASLNVQEIAADQSVALDIDTPDALAGAARRPVK